MAIASNISNRRGSARAFATLLNSVAFTQYTSIFYLNATRTTYSYIYIHLYEPLHQLDLLLPTRFLSVGYTQLIFNMQFLPQIPNPRCQNRNRQKFNYI